MPHDAGGTDDKVQLPTSTVFNEETETPRSNIVMAVANYALAHFKLNKMHQDQCFIDLYKMSLHINGPKNANFFAVPFNSWHPSSQEKISNFSKEEITFLQSYRICTSALLLILQRGSSYYTQQKKLAVEFGLAKLHGNVGRKRSVDTDEAIYAPVREFFEHITKLCETRATGTVRTMVGLKNSTDNIDQLYIPTHMSLRGCYSSYLSRLGYSVTFYNDGNYTVGDWASPDEDVGNKANPPQYVSLSCFYSVWQRDYGHIRVSKPSEDICNLCVAFPNRHKYQLSEANSSADGELFLKEPPDLTADFGSDDEWDEEDLVRQPKEESTLEPTEQIPQEKSKVDELMEDEGAAADDPELERREQMICRAYKHVEMARV
jgi:hypothetical protein